MSDPRDATPSMVPTRDGYSVTVPAKFPPAPRSAPHADAPGSYEVAPRILDPDIDPGDGIDVDVFFTGYGHIECAKLFFAPPTELIDTTKSHTHDGIAVSPNPVRGNRFLKFGLRSEPFSDGVSILAFRGMNFDDSPAGSYFFDDGIELPGFSPGPGHPLMTEVGPGGAPVRFQLKTQNSARPGVHTLGFFFTYFDGEHWRVSVRNVDVKISSWYERYAAWLTVVGVGLALLATLSVVSDPNVWDLLKRLGSILK